MIDIIGKGIGKVTRKVSGLQPKVIEWINPSEDEIVWKYPDEVIPWGSVVIVKEFENAIFYRDGKVYGVLGAGRHVLDTQNVPFLKGLVEGLYGESIFKSMVIFVSLRRFQGKFGGRTQTVELAPLLFHGSFYFRVEDPSMFVNKVVGPQSAYTTDELNEYLRGYFNEKIMAYLSKHSIQDVYVKQAEVTEKVTILLRKDFRELGIALEKVVFEGVDTEGEWRDRLFWIMKGGVQTGYVLQMETAKEVAKELGKSPGAGIGTGMVMIPPLMQPPPPQPAPTTPTAAPTATVPPAYTPRCPYCGQPVPAGAKFCPYCGKQVKWCSKGHLVPFEAKFCPVCGESVT
ncbi:MAG: SPFH domain-containing protein [archaeon GB-1867-035]|nr:SPFH domain-containing protein [Candidatus Culexmicrobium profundum]